MFSNSCLFLLLFFSRSSYSLFYLYGRSSLGSWLRFLYREINFDDGTRRALIHTLGTHAALLWVDVAHIVLDGDSLKLAHLLTLTASDASSATNLLSHSPLVLVHALHIDLSALRTLLADLDDVARASLGAGTTASADVLIHLRQARLRIDGDGSKLAGSHTVAAAQTAKSTARLARSASIHGSTSVQAIILSDARTILARAITTYHCHLSL